MNNIHEAKEHPEGNINQCSFDWKLLSDCSTKNIPIVKKPKDSSLLAEGL